MVGKSKKIFIIKSFRGEGLGKEKQGNAEHVKVKFKDDNEGIGHSEGVAGAVGVEWWNDAFNNAASLLKTSQPKKKKRKRAQSSDSEESDSESESDNDENIVSLNRDMSGYTDEDIALFKACKGRRLGRRATTPQVGKMKREQKYSKKDKKKSKKGKKNKKKSKKKKS